MGDPLLAVRDLHVRFALPEGEVHAVRGVDLDLASGETAAIVGESGSGKSVSAMSILGLIPQPPGRITRGEIIFDGRNLLDLSPREMRRVRGSGIAMVFQDPMTSLNPVFRVGHQIAEAILTHQDVDEDEARERAIDLLARVGVPDAERRYGQWPHEYSGGMRQRALIAMAVANNPKVVLADEPTTALDVTIQAQVLDVLNAIQEHSNAGTVLITHDLGVIAEMADRVLVMYAGEIAEQADVQTIFHEPRHPYTVGLMGSLPRLEQDMERLVPIPGQPPSMIRLPPGCSFHPRCALSRGRARCREQVPPLYRTDAVGHRSACHFHDEVGQEVERVESLTGVDIEGVER